MGPFPSSFGNIYILLAVNYVSKWVEPTACPRNDVITVVGFIQKNILSKFRASKTIISDEGSHFAKKVFAKLMSRYVMSAKLIYVLSSFHMLFCAFNIHIHVKLIKFPLNLVL